MYMYMYMYTYMDMYMYMYDYSPHALRQHAYVYVSSSSSSFSSSVHMLFDNHSNETFDRGLQMTMDSIGGGGGLNAPCLVSWSLTQKSSTLNPNLIWRI
jgi:hypothetical protein